jgi:hypothetical protein
MSVLLHDDLSDDMVSQYAQGNSGQVSLTKPTPFLRTSIPSPYFPTTMQTQRLPQTVQYMQPGQSTHTKSAYSTIIGRGRGHPINAGAQQAPSTKTEVSRQNTPKIERDSSRGPSSVRICYCHAQLHGGLKHQTRIHSQPKSK